MTQAPDDSSVASRSYCSSQLDDIDALIATFAHELGHLYLSPVKTQPPGGDIASEPATDICAIFLGFGIFTANSAFRFKELRGINTSGYSASHLGYLNEASLAYALAIFTELKGIPPETVGVHLKANPRSFHRNAVKNIRRRWMARFKRLRRL